MHLLVSHSAKIHGQTELVLCVELRGVHVAAQVAVHVIFAKMTEDFVPHVEALNPLTVNLFGTPFTLTFTLVISRLKNFSESLAPALCHVVTKQWENPLMEQQGTFMLSFMIESVSFVTEIVCDD